MAKFVAKGEPRSQAVSSLFKACVGGLRDNSDSRSALRCAMIWAVGERDFSAQETTHTLLSLPLVSCTFNFAFTGDRQIVEDADSGELVIQQSLFDHYCTGTKHLDISLLQFAAEFSVYKGKVRRHPSAVIVRTFPHYSSNPKPAFIVPKFRTGAYQYSFFPNTLSLWNDLPKDIFMHCSFNSFKRSVLLYL